MAGRARKLAITVRLDKPQYWRHVAPRRKELQFFAAQWLKLTATRRASQWNTSQPDRVLSHREIRLLATGGQGLSVVDDDVMVALDRDVLLLLQEDHRVVHALARGPHEAREVGLREA